jgi:opine dehydrogenase
VKVAILGAGAIGLGGAAFLSQRGHEPVVWSPSGAGTSELARGTALQAHGAIEGSFSISTAHSCEAAIAQAEVVFIAVPGNAHRRVFDAAAPNLRNGQLVIVSGHLSFGALYLRRQLEARGIDAPVVAWGTTVTSGRKRGPSEVHVNSVRERVDLATVPVAAAARGLETCRVLFGDRFVPRADLLAIAVSNLNPQNHMGIALCNLTRMERGEQWDQYENITQAVGRLLEALDAERLAIAASLSVEVRTIVDHFHLSFHVPRGSMAEMARALHDKGPTLGPTTLESRYVLEDVPFGLVATARLGRLAGTPARLHESGIDIFSALYGRDFWQANDLLPAIGFDTLSLGELKDFCRG